MKKTRKKLDNTSTWIIVIIACGLMSVGLVLGYSVVIPIGLGIIAGTLFLNSIVTVPIVHFGIPTRFGKRIKRNEKTLVLEEGLKFVYPLLEDLTEENVVEKKLITTEMKTSAISKDLLEIILEGSVQYRPYDLNTFIEMTETTIHEGIMDAIESEFGKICGTKIGDDFVKSRAEIETLINCVLRLERPPHYYLNEANQKNLDAICKEFRRRPCEEKENQSVAANKVMGIIISEKDLETLRNKLQENGFQPTEIDEKIARLREIKNKLDPNEWKLLAEERKKEEVKEVNLTAFYSDNITRISILFGLPDLPEQISPVEKLYGIDVAVFRVAKIGFSKEIQEAFEERRSASAEMEAAEIKYSTKKEFLKGYITAGVSPEAAVNLVETTTGEKGVERHIVSVEGSRSGITTDLLAFARLLGIGGSQRMPGGKREEREEREEKEEKKGRWPALEEERRKSEEELKKLKK